VSTGMRALKANLVLAWYLPIDDLLQHPWARYADLLSSDERDRASHLIRPSDRYHYMAAHALLRVMLSNFTGLPAKMCRFRLGPQGRPELEPGLSGLPLRFSLSHTDGLVAAAITMRSDIGLDVEELGRPLLDIESVVRFFAAEEITHLNDCAPELRERAFFEIWTMKEAFVKATGFGLSLPLNQFAVALDPHRLVCSPPHWGPSELWQFWVARPSPRHQLAIVARSRAGTTLRFVVSRVAVGTLRPEADVRL
jgi:4'-phosphopantetheinyl transferase